MLYTSCPESLSMPVAMRMVSFHYEVRLYTFALDEFPKVPTR
jgi:hypothetical protein